MWRQLGGEVLTGECLARGTQHNCGHHITHRALQRFSLPHQGAGDACVVRSRLSPRLVRYPPQGGWQAFLRSVVPGACFLCRLRTSVHRFPLWTALPSAEYYQWI